jgi:alpha-beta hydrolase superfamily lysophospholipase
MFTKPQPYADIIDNFLKDIPQKYSIAATNNLGSHLSHRQKIFTVPIGIDEADIIVFLLNDNFAAPTLDAQKQMAENMKHDKKYIEIFKTGDFIVFEKRNLYAHTEPDVDKIKLFPYSIQTLEERDFAGGKITIIKKLEKRKEFTSYLISYPSDGLRIIALMDVPTTKKPVFGFPVVIIDHGFIKPSSYDTEKSYRFITDFFALHGFLVIKPDYRGNGNSEKDADMSYILSYPIDVLNLISSITNIENADPAHIFLWGHSTGSAITLTTLAANNQNPDYPIKIKGAALWSSVTDPYRAYQQFRSLYPTNRIPYQRTVKLLGTPGQNPILWQSVSPLFYLGDINTPIQIMHGTNDAVVPYQWSIEVYNDLVSLNKQARLQVYPNDDHVLSTSRKDALNKNLQFFQILLK